MRCIPEYVGRRHWISPPIERVGIDSSFSAGGSIIRTDFERMVTQVCLGEVGAVCAREVSRFARNSREWAAYDVFLSHAWADGVSLRKA
jgi:DNA invertase Pin-like site-specific DNA recombinase